MDNARSPVDTLSANRENKCSEEDQLDVRQELLLADRLTPGLTAYQISLQIRYRTNKTITAEAVSQYLSSHPNLFKKESITIGEDHSPVSCWRSCELEMTSQDEVERLVRDLNDNIKNKNYNQFSTHQYLPKQVSHRVEVKVQKSYSADRNDHHPVGQRFVATAVLTIDREINEGAPFSVIGHSAPCLTCLSATIRAYHKLLSNMSVNNVFELKFQEHCAMLYNIAYDRGQEFKFGSIYPFDESTYTEFKGAKNERRTWPYRIFMNAFKKNTVRTICAFVNTRLLGEVRPYGPCRIVYGVKNGSKFIHGITVPPIGDPKPGSTWDEARKEYLSDQQSTLQQMLRQQLMDTVKKTLSGSNKQARLIANATRVQMIPVAKDIPYNQLCVIVVVSVVFNADFTDNQPCLLGTNDQLQCYTRTNENTTSTLPPTELVMRTPLPETKRATLADVQQLFGHGVPQDVLQGLGFDPLPQVVSAATDASNQSMNTRQLSMQSGPSPAAIVANTSSSSFSDRNVVTQTFLRPVSDQPVRNSSFTHSADAPVAQRINLQQSLPVLAVRDRGLQMAIPTVY